MKEWALGRNRWCCTNETTGGARFLTANRRPSTPHSSKGFTLLEVLLALSILGIMGTMIFGSFRGLVDATSRAENAMDELHVVETLANRIADSLEAAVWFDSDPERYEFRHEIGTGTLPADTLSWVTTQPPFQTGERDGLIRVELGIGDPDGEEALMMKTMSSLWDEDDPEVEDLEAVEITRSVKGLKFWCYDAQEQEWVEEWERERQLPLSVVLILTLQQNNERGSTRDIVRRVDLPLAPLSRATTRGRRAVEEPTRPGSGSTADPRQRSISIEAPPQ